MSAIKPLLHSMRLRTLPLSLSGVVCGGVLGYSYGNCGFWTLPLLFLTTVSLQVLSNLSNELGDHLSGVDGAGRKGPNYSLAEGGLTVPQMWRAINGTVIVCCISGVLMLFYSWFAGRPTAEWSQVVFLQPLSLLLLGAAAIWAATHYTLGKKPYGYRGLGDLYVFVFFGLVTVVGGFFVTAHTFSLSTIPLGIGIGLFSVAVLNVNNIRDMESDRGIRRTIPLRIGKNKAKWYQTLLICFGWIALCATPWLICHETGSALRIIQYAFVITLPFYVLHLAGVWRRDGSRLDPMLPLLVISTFLLSVIFTITNYGV